MNKLRLILTLNFLLFIFNLSFAQFKFAGNIKSQKQYPNRVEFVLDNAKFNLYVYDENLVRFRFTNKNEFSKAPSYAVIYELPSKTNFTFKDEGKYFSVTTKELIVRIFKSPCRIKIYDSEMNLINEDEESFGVCFDNNEVKCFKKQVEGETFYGLGEKTGNLNRTGKAFNLWNSDYPNYTNRTDELYQSIPFFYGIRPLPNPPQIGRESMMIAYGIFFDNTYKSHFNFGASNNRFNWFGAAGGEMDYYFIWGPEIKKILISYTKLTGRMEMPPMWALGYQQCRWSYYPESTVRNIADNFRNRKIPCDVIYLDIDYMDEYRVFTWDKTRFPDPPKMLSDLKSKGFKIVTIIDPGVKADSNYFVAKEGMKRNFFAKYPDGVFYQGQVWPKWSYFPDFSKKETRSWWGDKVTLLLKDGVEGIWNDMNEPATWGQDFPDIVEFDDNGFKANHKKIHNVYALGMAQATYEGFKNHSPNKRHLMLTRAGYSGIQRYSAVWTGDNISDEENLKLACTMPLNMGIGGLPFIGSDVGGFSDITQPPSKKLYIRWMQLAVFAPFFRQHSAIGTYSKEPWNLGESVERTVRDAINLRYKLLPYLYNEFYISAQTGFPIMRPMFMEYQNNPESYSDNSQYQFMFGEKMLIAPVLSEKETIKHIFLPDGNWYELNTNKFYNGNQNMIIDVPIDIIPMFVKEGGFIPMQEVQQYVGEKKIEQTEVIVYPPNSLTNSPNSILSSQYSFYEDDGISFDNLKGKYSLTKFTCERKNNIVEITVNKEKEGYKNDRKYYLFKVITGANPSAVKVVNDKLKQAESLDNINNASSGYYFNEKDRMIYIKTADLINFNVKIEF